MLQEPPERPVGAEDSLARLAAVPMLGRESLLAALHSGLDALGQGRGQCFLLAGDAGIGKTRLLEELAGEAVAQGIDVRQARCHEDQGAPAFWPWKRIVSGLCAERDGAAMSELVGPRPGPLLQLLPESGEHAAVGPSELSRLGAADAETRFQLFEEVTSLLERAARKKPLLIVIDDLHWADPASVMLARFLAREAKNLPVAILAAYRDSELSASDPLAAALGDLADESRVLQLSGLDESHVAHLMRHVAGFEVAGVLSAAVRAQTAGNPLFVAEVVRVLVSEGRLGAPQEPTPSRVPLPESIRHSLRRRVGALSPVTRDLLVRAAVIGTNIDVELLARCAELPRAQVIEGLGEACERRLVQVPAEQVGHFRFAHDLIRESLYQDLPATERMQHHRRAALAIQQLHGARLERHFAELARHFLEAAPIGTAFEAADYAMRAGREAAERYSFEEAARQYQRALRAVEIADETAGESPAAERIRVRALLALGEVEWWSGERARARERHHSAAKIARELGDPELLARAGIALTGRTDLPMEFPAEASDLLEEALEALPRRDHRLRARVLTNLVRAKYYGEERSQIEAWAREGVAIAERLADPPTLFGALEALHYALFMPDSLAERRQIADRLPALARESRSQRYEALARLWRTVDLLEVPDIAAADAELGRFETLGRELGQPFYHWLATALRATRALMAGRLADAERLTFEAFELGRRADSPNAFTFFGTQLFHLREEQGRIAEILPVMRKIADENPALPVFKIGIPLIHSLLDRRVEAAAAFEAVGARDFEDVPRDTNRLPMLSTAAAVAAYLGDGRRARLILEELQPHTGRVLVAGVGTYWGGAIDRYIAALEETLGDFDAAVGHFEAALSLARRAGARLLAAHTQCDLAHALDQRAAVGDVEKARELRSDASATYRDLGIEWRREKLASALEATERTFDPGARVDAPSRMELGGGHWRIGYGGRSIRLPDSKGLRYVAQLVGSPQRRVHVLELMAAMGAAETSDAPAAEDGLRVTRGSGMGALLDARARAEYREHLHSLRRDLERAEREGDLACTTRLREEVELIEEELVGAVGLAGRARPSGDPAERARKAVYNRVRSAIKMISGDHPELGVHLQNSIRTGTFCTYVPERDTPWEVG